MHARRDGVLVAHGEDAFEELGLFVPQHNAEDVVIDKALDVLGDAAEEFFAVEDRGQFAADLVEEYERLGLLGVGSDEALRDGIGVADHRKGSEFGVIFHIGIIRVVCCSKRSTVARSRAHRLTLQEQGHHPE